MSKGKKWVGLNLDDDTNDAFRVLATLMSQSPITLAVDVFKVGLETIAERRKNKPVSLRLWLAVRAQGETDRTRRHLDQLGYQAKTTNSEEKMEVFIAFCRELNLDPAHVLDEIDINRAPTPISLESSGTSVQMCAEWLLRNLVPGKQYAMRTIETRSNEMGFSKYALENAKSQLGIKSDRVGKRWVWTLPGAPIMNEKTTVVEIESIDDEQVSEHKVETEANVDI